MRAGVRALVFILNYMSKKGVPAAGGTQNPVHLSSFAAILLPEYAGVARSPQFF